MIDDSKLSVKELELKELGWQLVHWLCSEDNCEEANEMICWLKKNKIPYESVLEPVEHEVVDYSASIWVDCVENAMAFKLRWCNVV